MMDINNSSLLAEVNRIWESTNGTQTLRNLKFSCIRGFSTSIYHYQYQNSRLERWYKVTKI